MIEILKHHRLAKENMDTKTDRNVKDINIKLF